MKFFWRIYESVSIVLYNFTCRLRITFLFGIPLFFKLHNIVILTSLKIQFDELIYAVSLRYDHIIVIENRKIGCTSVHCTSHCSSLHLSHLYCFIVVQKWLRCYVLFDYQVPLFCINQCDSFHSPIVNWFVKIKHVHVFHGPK